MWVFFDTLVQMDARDEEKNGHLNGTGIKSPIFLETAWKRASFEYTYVYWENIALDDGICQHSTCFYGILVPSIIIKMYFSIAKVHQNETEAIRYVYYPTAEELAWSGR
jgi:hypothetical protein